MNENIETNVQKLSPFTRLLMTIGELPTSYLMSMTYYEQIIWFTKYLQEQVIPAVNTNAEAVEEVQEIVTELQNYVNHYFDNLDVQEEINNKIDKMIEDGEFQEIISRYVNPLLISFENNINEEISEFENTTNGRITTLQNQVNGIASGSPLAASSTDEMTETDKIYVNTTDGKWYFYDGNSWEIGGTFQSSVISESDPIITRIDDSLNNSGLGSPNYTDKTISTSGSTVDITSQHTAAGYKCWVINCSAGDVFTITGTGGATPRLWCFIDSSGNSLLKADSMHTATQESIIAPENASKLILNINGSGIIYKGYSVDNRLGDLPYIRNQVDYKVNCITETGSTILASSENAGLYDMVNKTIFSSETSHYNVYSVEAGKKYYVTGKSSTNATRYSLLGVYDKNDNLLFQYGTTNNTAYSDYLLTIPKNGVKLIVNGSTMSSENILVKNSVPDHDLAYQLPDYVINILGNKQLGKLSKPYFCISCDDGDDTLYTNTIPNIIEQIYQDTGVKVPFTFGLMSDSDVVEDATELNAVKGMITNYGCSVAQHGHGDFRNLTESELLEYLDSEKVTFTANGITTKGLIYPNNASNNLVQSICGGLYGACCGGGIDETRASSKPRDNMFKLYRISMLNLTLPNAKAYIDYAYSHNYLICMFFHDNAAAGDSAYTEKIVNIVEYAIQKGMNFCTIGDIPTIE